MSAGSLPRPAAGRWAILLPALPLLVVCLAGTRAAAENQSTVASAWAYTLASTAALSLVLRRRAPRVGVSVAAVATAAYLLLDQPYGPVFFAGPVWAWCLTLVLPLRRAVLWLTGFLVVVVAAAAPGGPAEADRHDLVAAGTALVLLLAAGAGTGFALAARARADAAARTALARRAVSEERLAMAQDVHDGVGHSLAVIALQAGVAAHVIDRDPDRAKELLRTLASTSRAALDGLRDDLDRLRDPEAAAARTPGPGLADLPVLLDRMRDGGLRLHAVLDPPPAVPPEVGAVAYRIVQESLTNVLRHARTDEASVQVRPGGATAGGGATDIPPALLVEVADRGSGPAAGTGGTGIPGMRRRAESVGGRLSAGPRDGGGFLVRAELPA